ncbi:MAG: PA0069 family radical SAM protein [Planctomycetales bacterium]|nr:PA0069 family radical SAM protein [Planctomycetales bacterium]
MPDHPPDHNLPRLAGRGAQTNPNNRFHPIHLHADYEQLEADDEFFEGLSKVSTEYFEDDSQSILSENNSPDIPFRYSLNPYRGCAHGCAYCYARPTHEYLGLSAGVDFESKIFVKMRAAELLSQHLTKKSWQPEPIMMSGVTDCYQPAERQFRITRACLEVARKFGQPIGIVTKNALITRDIDILADMASHNLTRVAVSLTSLDQSLTRVLEPRTSSPASRLRAMRELSSAGIPVIVMTAPIIPGLNDSEIPSLLQAARQHGATFAGYTLLRLPLTVKPVFLDWLAKNVPGQQAKIEHLIQQTRDGGHNQSQFGQRMRGSGAFAEHLSSTFKIFAHKHQLQRQPPPLDCSRFALPAASTPQLWLF